MQNSNVLAFQVLKADGEIFASLTYPKGTKVWEVFQDVKEKVAKSESTTQPHIILRSSKGTILQPHRHLDTILHAHHGDHIVVEFESSDSKAKNAKGAPIKQVMKTGCNKKPASQDAVVSDKKRTLPDRGKSGWGNYKIPLKNVTKETPNRIPRSRRDKTPNSVQNNGQDSKTDAMRSTSVDQVAANSALGSLMQNYSNSDDEDEDEEEDNEVVFKDECAQVVTRTESRKKRTRTNNEDDSIDDDTCVINAESSSKKVKKGSNPKNKLNESDKSKEGNKSSGNTSFAQGVGLFLQCLQSESKKPHQAPISIGQKPRQAPISIGHNADKKTTTSKDWPFKSSLRTYSRQSPRLSNAFIPPDIKRDVVLYETESSNVPNNDDKDSGTESSNVQK
ncbi:uncharacterized protein [Amphiura filiformis]|uniref:uncharacterized protein n=1 Tax=Amphiura filiformis TaxID=82378 RepID=UPI003B211F83